MSDATQRYDFDRVFRLLITVAALVGTFWLLAYLSEVLVPFAVAVMLAYLLNPIVNAFERKTHRRGVAVGLTLAIFAVAFLVLFPLLISFVYNEVVAVSEVIASHDVKEKIVAKIEPLTDVFTSPEFREQLEKFKESTDSEEIKQLAIKAASVILPEFWDITLGVFGLLGSVIRAVFALTAVLIILLYLIFLLMDFNSLQAGWKEHLPPQYRESIVEFLNEFSRAMSRYFRGQFLVAACCGILFAVGFKIVGVRMAVLVGLSIGMLNMVPYLQTVGLVPAILLALLKAFESSSSPLVPIVGVLLVFVVVQLIQDALLVPKIMGQATGLKPWVIMLSIFVWGKLLGFLGLVLAIPLSCLGLAYYRRFILEAPDERKAT